MTPAETLTAAADLIERLAGDATPGPWRAAEQGHGEWVGIQSQFAALAFTWSAGDANYAATLNPAAAILLAPVLRWAATADNCPCNPNLLAFAQALIEGEST